MIEADMQYADKNTKENMVDSIIEHESVTPDELEFNMNEDTQTDHQTERKQSSSSLSTLMEQDYIMRQFLRIRHFSIVQESKDKIFSTACAEEAATTDRRTMQSPLNLTLSDNLSKSQKCMTRTEDTGTFGEDEQTKSSQR